MTSTSLTCAFAAAAAFAVAALFILIRRKQAGGAAPGDLSGFNSLLKDIETRLRDGRIDQETADAERQRLLQSLLSLNAAGAAPGWRPGWSPATLAVLAVTLTAAFVFAVAQDEGAPRVADGRPPLASSPHPGMSADAGMAAAAADPALSRLQAYARTVADETQAASPAGSSPASSSMSAATSARAAPALADVDTMIARLATRLEKNPDDPEGWRMLGWSWLNTGNYDKAVEAYARALALKPDSEAFKAAHAEALAKAGRGKEATDAAAAVAPAAPPAAAPEPAPETPAASASEPATTP